MSQESILVVEDDKHISKLIKHHLEKSGYKCISSISGEGALDILTTNTVDLIVLDVGLPKMNGFETCKTIRQDRDLTGIPIIMLTARGEEVDQVVGLELGVDDYMVKPFSPRELVLRVEAILRRKGVVKEDVPTEREVLRAGILRVNIPKHQIMVSKKSIDLSPMEFKLLVTLMSRQGRIQSREALLEDVWGFSADVTTRTIDTHIKLLRQKLGKAGKLIVTVRGIGYKISGDA